MRKTLGHMQTRHPRSAAAHRLGVRILKLFHQQYNPLIKTIVNANKKFLSLSQFRKVCRPLAGLKMVIIQCEVVNTYLMINLREIQLHLYISLLSVNYSLFGCNSLIQGGRIRQSSLMNT